ncbi:unnamed protein product (macronuclear) [Paramecium tetraurelia]|uniref:Small EDRK-rich factor-like N-terminal domain-containing protein n=1 Tax=Paramecium tetraurelia TaxID=5888 RepID=A0BIH0_PARTE|nr:uncharacterized protein GSPATT00004709001 [Paramecium tetraurelia]CAK58337.1 unnamed protein product [Paramecium tetraurelia]|eukprot:XP_001425735.1 hypothetical protein (macronuclear) [Paramecium tetraurelia strain d4-2]
MRMQSGRNGLNDKKQSQQKDLNLEDKEDQLKQQKKSSKVIQNALQNEKQDK